MSHQVIWTDALTEAFIVKGALSEEEAFIMRTRARGYTVSQQAQKLNKSESSIHRMIAGLKVKYDVVQKENPLLFPVRKTSKTEEFMDKN